MAIRKFDALILGAGAAGLMCAIEAGRRGRRIAVLEASERAGKKILISGGGRCNFTNIHCQPENFISYNRHFAKSALARYTPADFIRLVEKHHIPYHEKTLGQLFCDREAADITRMLDEERRAAAVEIFLKSKVCEVIRTTEFVVRTDGDEFHASCLVVATGGLSIPKMGATSFGYELASQFGVKIRETKPGLVAIVLSASNQKQYCDLSGVSMEVIASIDAYSFREKMLITHRGMSGPAILQISSYWDSGVCIHIDLAPGVDITETSRRQAGRNIAMLKTAMQGVLPARVAARWLDLHPLRNLSNQALMDFERELHDWHVSPVETEGYQKAEVTVGGVDTDELSAKTMEARRVPGLFFIGEVVDVTGHLGGFNFQWAWASGAAAGRAI